MNYDEFKESIAEQIRDVLPEKYRDAIVEVYPMEKINKSYEALFVMPPDENTTFAVNLEQFYERYAGGSMTFQDTLSAVAEMIQQEPPVAINLEELRNYETAKERLFMQVCSVEKNQELLEVVPHRTEEDLAVTYHLLIGETEGGLFASALVTDSHLEVYGVSEEQLHQDAVENSQKLFPATLIPMQTVLDEIFHDMHEEMIEAGMPEAMAQIMLESMMPQEKATMYVLTNEQRMNGAGVLFYPEVMDQLGDTLGSDYIILPSSTHETLIVPDDGRLTALETQDLVADVNSTMIHPEDRLTDESYHYDRAAHVFEKFSSYEARMDEKEKESALDAEVPQNGENGDGRTVPGEHARAERQEKKQAARRANDDRPAPKRESVLKKLEAKKTAAKEREAGKAKENTRSAHNRSDNALA
ncbi:MAG: DUF5688 family protein [Clostridiales bacterium]|nr:DUF5688 family protein [Clostridiales bacterium]